MLELPSQVPGLDRYAVALDRPWRVPYCASCLRHVEEAQALRHRLLRGWGIAALILYVPLWPIIWGVPILFQGIVLGTSATRLLVKLKAGRIAVGPTCAAALPAVRRSGPSRGVYVATFLNRAYGERFAAARQGQERGSS